MSLVQNKKRQLIFLWTYTNWGGAQVYFFAIMKLACEEWDVSVIIPRNSKPDLLKFLDDLGVRYEFLEHCFDAKPAKSVREKLRRQYERIRSEIECFLYLRKFDLSESVLHIEIAPWQSWILLTLLALRRANVFATLHNFRPDISLLRKLVWRTRLQIVSRLAGFHIFASNNDTKQHLKPWVTDRFWKAVKVTYTCVDPGQIAGVVSQPFDKVVHRRKLGVPEDKFVVLAVGQFIDRKGRWIFLEAAARLRETHSDLAFVWVMPEEIKTKADLERVGSYGLGDSFYPVLSSSIGHDRLAILDFFRTADVFALPSFVEGLPIALLEAMALGIPSISTDVYAIPEAVKHEKTGLLIPAGDVDALAEAIIRLKKNESLRSLLSKEGSEFVLNNFDERKAAAICIDSYRSCFN